MKKKKLINLEAIGIRRMSVPPGIFTTVLIKSGPMRHSGDGGAHLQT